MMLAGQEYASWTRCEVTRDLGDISGSFIFDYDDRERYAALLPQPDAGALTTALSPGPAATILVDDEVVMIGHVVDVSIEGGPEELRANVFGLDKTGDLVDCSANPEGPAEYNGLDVLQITQRLVQPFGMTAKAEADVGDPLPRFSIDVGESVISAIEKATRQRGLLVVSDGVGGIVLTQAGKRRGPQPLILGGETGNIHRFKVQLSWKGRYSDHYVKGQLPHVRSASQKRRAVALDSSTAPLGEGAPIALPPAGVVTDAGKHHRHGRGHHGKVYQSGHATDPGVDRYRPRVYVTRAQSGLDTVDQQAEWRMRTSIAAAANQSYTMAGFRPAEGLPLWRPNEVVPVTDPVRGLNGVDQLIAGVVYLDGEDGPRSVLRVVNPDLYTLDDEDVGPRAYGRARPKHQHAVDATSRRYR